MSVHVLGLNHNSAPVDIRERFSFGPDIVVAALRGLCDQPAINGGVILSTCNRTEVYCASEEPDPGLINWICEFHGLEPGIAHPHLYHHRGRHAVAHLLAVASGLDSLVLGEPQILGQVKAAYQVAKDAGKTGKVLDRLFQHAFSSAKHVRTHTNIGDSPVSVAFAAVGLARQIFTDMTEQSAMLVGAGETIELAARHLVQQGIGRMIVANRTLERAHELAAQFDGYAIALPEIPAHLPEADIVICSTASPLPILGKGTVESALRKRRHRPMLMIDIAVPRDIEAEVADLEDVYLYTVDDLDQVIEENRRSRQEAAVEAHEIVELQVEVFQNWLRSLEAVDIIQDYRARAEATRDVTLKKARDMLRAGKPPEQVLEHLARVLTNRLIHVPSTQLREAGTQGRRELLDAANTLFQLNRDSDQP